MSQIARHVAIQGVITFSVIEYPKRKAAENEKFPTELVASLRYNARFVYFLIFNRGFFLCN